MVKPRVSIFGDDEAVELDIAGFAPKPAVDDRAPAAEKVREVPQAANFKSREPVAAKTETPAKRPIRRYRTGRNVQFNIKALQETVNTFYAITEDQDWVLGYTLERAVEALKRELKLPT